MRFNIPLLGVLSSALSSITRKKHADAHRKGSGALPCRRSARKHPAVSECALRRQRRKKRATHIRHRKRAFSPRARANRANCYSRSSGFQLPPLRRRGARCISLFSLKGIERANTRASVQRRSNGKPSINARGPMRAARLELHLLRGETDATPCLFT